MIAVLAACVISSAVFGADFPGKWKMTAEGPDGNTYKFDLVVKDESGKLSANVVSERGTVAVQELTASGDELSFKMPYEIGPIAFKLKQTGNAMKGMLTIPDGATGAVTGTKEESTAAQASLNVSGKWKISSKDAGGREMQVLLDLKQDGSKLTGEMTTDNGDVLPIAEGKLEGDQISFKIPTDQGSIVVTGTISGSTVKGSYKSPDGATGNFTGSKQ
jgi:hypothetical protein